MKVAKPVRAIIHGVAYEMAEPALAKLVELKIAAALLPMIEAEAEHPEHVVAMVHEGVLAVLGGHEGLPGFEFEW